MKVVLKVARLAFPDLFVAVKIDDDPTSTPRFTSIFIVEPGGANAKALLAAVSQVGAEKWKTKWPAVCEVLKAKDRICFRTSHRWTLLPARCTPAATLTRASICGLKTIDGASGSTRRSWAYSSRRTATPSLRALGLIPKTSTT